MPKILYLEDDFLIAKSLRMSLGYQGFEVTVAGSLAEAEHVFAASPFDLVLLDVNLPDGDSFAFCHKIRLANPEIPIVMLTARTDEQSAIHGMSEGADDYVRKPFGVEELTLRMKKLLSRVQKNPKELQFGGLKLDLLSRRAWSGTYEIPFGKKEFEIVSALVKKNGNVVTREEILQLFGDASEVFDRTIDSHLSHIRRKFREAKSLQLAIVPVYGVGYRLELCTDTK